MSDLPLTRHRCGPGRARGGTRVRGASPSLCWALALLAGVVLGPRPAGAVPPGTEIRNTAFARYNLGQQSGVTSASNSVSIFTVSIRTPSSLELLRYAPSFPGAESVPVATTWYSTSGTAAGPFVPLPPPMPLGGSSPLDLAGPLPLVGTQVFREDEPVFLRLTDLDQNVDSLAAETIVVTIRTSEIGDEELLRLTETGPSTGVFTGYVQSESTPTLRTFDGTLGVSLDSELRGSYFDVVDPADTSEAMAWIDPIGIVFDSATGEPVDGAEITLLDADTGLPATVLGDDEVSAYPATVASGATVTDGSGKPYPTPPGGFRFPSVPPGRYRLAVLPPPTHSAPSLVPTEQLQTLAGAPFRIVDGSRGEDFAVDSGRPSPIDFPVDPAAPYLSMLKSSATDHVAVGDFASYELRVENHGSRAVDEVTVSDRLPHGFRYESGSTRIDGTPAADPAVSSDGRTLTFVLGGLEAGASRVVRYVVEVGAGAALGDAVNTAVARDELGTVSNASTATVRVTEDLLRSRAIIMGRVGVDDCGDSPADSARGAAGVRLFLEDGTYTVTDSEGRYHFEGVRPGTHVVQLDTGSIPERHEIAECERNTRFAGSARSQFVDVQGGTVWRADFHLRYIPEPVIIPRGDVGLELGASVDEFVVDYETRITNRDVPLRNVRLTIVLPDGIRYLAGSSALDEAALADPEVGEGTLVYRLGDASPDWSLTLSFRGMVAPGREPGDLSTKGMLVFDSPTRKGQRTPVVETVLALASESERTRTPDVVLHPRFESLSAQLRDEDLPALEEAISQLRGREILHMFVSGHTDVRPVPASKHHLFADNYALSEARARSVAAYIAGTLALDADQVTVTGHGADQPLDEGMTAEAHAVNRRVELRVVAQQVRERRELTNVLDFSAVSTATEGEPTTASRQAEERTRPPEPAPSVKPAPAPGPVTLDYRLRLLAPPRNLRLQVVLPRGAHYVEGSSTAGGGEPLDDPDRLGDALLYHLSPTPAAEGVDLAFRATVAEDREGDDFAARAMLLFDAATAGSLAPIGEPLRLLPEGRTVSAPAVRAAPPRLTAMPVVDESFVGSLPPGRAWLWPPEGYSPPIPNIKVLVQHEPEATVALLRDGVPVSPLDFDATLADQTGTVAASHWSGVELEEGDNRLQVVTVDEDGGRTPILERVVHYSGPPVRAELVPEESRLVADGRTPTVIAVRLFDATGHPARGGVTGEFSVDPPHVALTEVEALQADPLSGLDGRRIRFRVDPDGIARIELQPTPRAGEAVVRLALLDREQEIRVWLDSDARDWVLVGLAEGSAGYNRLTGHAENLPPDVEEDYWLDGRLAFYAKGRVRGQWLLTMSVDTDKESDDVGNSIFQTIDPDAFYTLYGDATRQDYDAASAKKIYVRLERPQFYALFGDYDTGLTLSELARYSRRFTGLKAEARTRDWDANVFLAETAHGFVKDEIRGEGISGLYRLSRAGIVENSETVVIETRDRFHSEVILSTRHLLRHVDYSIDYDAGTLFFREPVPSQDQQLDPVFIVVDYETRQRDEEFVNFGGRVAGRAVEARVEVGATFVHDEDTSGEGDLYGADARMQVAAGTELEAEYVVTDTDLAGRHEGYRAELTRRDGTLSGRAYFREQEGGFGLGQQNASEAGTRKFGADADYRLRAPLQLSAEGYRQVNLATDGERDVAEARAQWTEHRYGLNTGVRFAEDRLPGSDDRRSTQLRAGGSARTLDERVQLRVDREQSLGSGNNANPDFPTRTVFGADVDVIRHLTVYGTYELTDGESGGTQASRVGLRAALWTGSQVSTSLGREHHENGARTFANLGLRQAWRVNERWSFDAGLDHSFAETGAGQPQLYANVPPASGTANDFTAVSLGTAYRHGLWQWNTRVEFHFSDLEDKWVLAPAVLVEPNDRLGLSGRARIFDSESVTGAETTQADVRLGLAYRPPRGRWIWLERLDYVHEDRILPDFRSRGRRLVSNTAENVRIGRRTQLAANQGVKYSRETIDGRRYDGWTTLFGLEARHDVTDSWDVGLRHSLLRSWDTRRMDHGTGVSIGHRLFDQGWISVGYNVTGFRDADFAADVTAQGPFVQFRLKMDQESVREWARFLRDGTPAPREEDGE